MKRSWVRSRASGQAPSDQLVITVQVVSDNFL